MFSAPFFHLFNLFLSLSTLISAIAYFPSLYFSGLSLLSLIDFFFFSVNFSCNSIGSLSLANLGVHFSPYVILGSLWVGETGQVVTSLHLSSLIGETEEDNICPFLIYSQLIGQLRGEIPKML